MHEQRLEFRRIFDFQEAAGEQGRKLCFVEA